jgi:hypothetical protein
MLFRFTWVFVAVGVLGAVWLLSTLRRNGSETATREPGLESGPVKILQFYASVGNLTKGEKALLCYGVENAKSVKISPLPEPLSPALSRCMEVVPQHTTHYTLMAEGFDGAVVTRSVTLPVTAAPPPPPQILRFAVQKGGSSVTLCYHVANAERIALDPEVIPPTSAPSGCFGVAPSKTTTYTLTAVGSGDRKAQRQVIVEIEGT